MEGYSRLSLDIQKLSKIWGKGIHSKGKLNSNEHYLKGCLTSMPRRLSNVMATPNRISMGL